MAGDPRTIDAILAKYRDARTSLASLQSRLADQERAITHGIAATGRKRPNDAEQAELKKIWAWQDQLDDAYGRMAWDELVLLDKSDAVGQLAKGFQDVKSGLDATLDDLRKDQVFADLTAQLADLLTQVGTGLASLGSL
jgi:hypothetical protein